MKRILPLFIAALLFVVSGYSQILRNVDFPAPSADPDRASTWLTWASNTDIYHMIGFDETTEYYAIQRFATEDLASYNGQQLTKIRFMPSNSAEEPTSAAYSVVVYTGGSFTTTPVLSLLNDPGTLVCSQVVTDITYGTWNTVTLNTPVTVDASIELWIGVKVTAYAGYAMSHDDAEPVEEKGNVMGYDGSWGVPSDFFSGSDIHNWNIAGLVTDGTEESVIDLSTHFVNNSTDFEEITSLNVPAGQPFRPMVVIRNEHSLQASYDYTDTITLVGYLDDEIFSTRHLSTDTLASGSGVWSQVTEMSSSTIFSQGYCGTTHTFCYEVVAANGWTDADLTNNRGCITVTFGEYSTLYHITVVNDDNTISPSGVVHMYPGGTQRFVITPPEGKRIAQALADGQDVTADVHNVINVGRTYTFYSIQSDHTFQVLYEDIPEDTVSVNDLTLPEMTLFPNPTTGVVHIQCAMNNAQTDAIDIQVFDVCGRMLNVTNPSDARGASPQTMKIDLSGYSAGIYFVKLVNDGKVIAVQKVVKE